MDIFDKVIVVCNLEPNAQGRFKKEAAFDFATVTKLDIYGKELKDELNKGESGQYFTYKGFKEFIKDFYSVNIDWDWREQVKNADGFYCSSEIYGCLPIFRAASGHDYVYGNGNS